MRLVRPTRAQALAAVVTILLGMCAVVAALLGSWPLAIAAVVLLLLEIVALQLFTARQLSSRLRHHTAVLTRTVERAAIDTVAVDSGAGAAEGPARLRVLDHWARVLLGSAVRRERFLQRAKRTRSHSARDLLAHSVTSGRYRYDDLAAMLESWRADDLDRLPREEAKALQPAPTLTLARLLYSQRTAERDLVDALTLYDVISSGTGIAGLADSDRSHYADLCVDQGRFQRARDVLAARPAETPAGVSAHTLLGVNATNPHLGASGADEASWLAGVNAVLEAGGFQPLRLADDDAEPFQRLCCDTATPVPDGPLVSVLMPIYEPDAATDKAIESILNQSWRNLELIVVDDGSPREDEDGRPTPYADQLRSWAGRDPRITLVLNEENHGAYWVRNQAYDLAQGEFVTVADKDDWHHPEQIEWQVRDLQADRGRVANMTSWVRVSPLLRFLVRWGPDRVVHPSFASIMFRREQVKARLGYWDTVRKGADNEFRHRLQQTYGFRLNPTESTPLIFSLMGESNLTSSDLGLGYEHEDRGAYSSAYRSWHHELADGDGSTYLERFPVDRPFPAPGAFLPDRVRGAHFDVVHVVELDSGAVRSRHVRKEVADAVDRGLRVGIVPAENFLDPGRPQLRLDAGIAAMVRSGVVTQLALATDATTDLLLIRPPSLFQICRDARAGLAPAEVVLVADEQPSSRRPARYRYDVGTVSRRVQAVFGVEPSWAATTEAIRQRLRPLVLRPRLPEQLWQGTGGGSDGAERAVRAEPVPHLALGGYDDPATRAWLDGLVTSVGGGAGVRDQDSPRPSEPTLVPVGVWGGDDVEIGPDDLAHLDVWMCLSERVEADAEQLTDTALAAGARLLLSQPYRSRFGEDAVYATPETARQALLSAAGSASSAGQAEDDEAEYEDGEAGSALEVAGRATSQDEPPEQVPTPLGDQQPPANR